MKIKNPATPAFSPLRDSVYLFYIFISVPFVPEFKRILRKNGFLITSWLRNGNNNYGLCPKRVKHDIII